MEKSKERIVAEAMIKDYFKMKPDEFLAITADQGSNFPQIDAFLEVAHEEGIKCTVVKTATPPGQSKAAQATIPVEATIAVLKNVDCWLDAGSMGLLYSDIFEEVTVKNKRMRYMLIVNLSTDLLYDMYCGFNADAMIELTCKIKDMLNESSEYTMRNAAGTDITFEMDHNNFICVDNGDASKYGVFTPPASVNVIPKQGTAKGVIACRALYADPEPNFVTDTPVFIHVENGEVFKIDGDEKGAAAMNKWYDKFAYDENAHKIAHTMIGMLPSVTEMSGYVVKDERLNGGSCWGIGHVSALDMPPAGQPSDTHFDVILEKVSVYLDGVAIMENGEFVHPDIKPIADKLVG